MKRRLPGHTNRSQAALSPMPRYVPKKMNVLQESLLAPWQKLEALRSQLIPSLSHHLASGTVKKDLLQEIDNQARSLLRNIARVPAATSRALFHASRRVGGLAITPLLEYLIQPDNDIPVDAFLSGDQSGGLYSFRHHSTRANLWTRARYAASRLH